MAKKQNSGSVSIANFIAVVGIVLLMVFSYIGYSYKSGGSMGISIGIAAGIAAIAGILLWFIIKAKSAENYLDKWKVAEIIGLVLYVIFAVSSAIYGGSHHFFVVNEQKEEIKRMAENDLRKIDKMFEDYEAFENEALSIFENGLMNATASRPNNTDELTQYLTNEGITRGMVETKTEYQKNKVLGTNYESLKSRKDDKKRKIMGSINNWSVLNIPTLSSDITDFAKRAETQLSELSKSGEMPVIKQNEANKFDLGENQVKEFAVEGGVENLEFQKGLTEAEGVSILGIVVILVIHLFILLNYIVTHRTRTVAAGKHTVEDGGRLLY